MSLKYKCVKTVPEGTDLEQIDVHVIVADLQKKNAALVPDASMLFEEIMINTTKATIAYNLWKKGDEASKIAFKEIMQILADGFYKNGIYYEFVANDTDNAKLFALLGYKSYKIPVSPEKASIKVFNTDILGVLLFILKAFKRTKYYNVEGVINTNGVLGKPAVFPSLPKSRGTSGGFVSGELYQLRTQAVFLDGTVGVWTPWFEIRVK